MLAPVRPQLESNIMIQYCILEMGREMPEPMTLTDARKALQTALINSLQRAKQKSKQATKHKLGDDNYLITLGRDRNSAIWASYCIAQY